MVICLYRHQEPFHRFVDVREAIDDICCFHRHVAFVGSQYLTSKGMSASIDCTCAFYSRRGDGAVLGDASNSATTQAADVDQEAALSSIPMQRLRRVANGRSPAPRTYNRRCERHVKIFQAAPGCPALPGDGFKCWGKGSPCQAFRHVSRAGVRQRPDQISPSQRSAAIRARLKDASLAARWVP